MSDQPEHLDLRSQDIAEDRRQELLRLFPEVHTEGGKLDFDRLKAVLGEAIDIGRERYGLTWPGKAQCLKTIQAPSIATLRPYRSESVDFDHTDNLIVEGDNLEVLKLLQKAYLAQVKMIYIDPPYNKGNDFIYPDDYSESLQTYLAYTGQVDAEGRRFSTNAETAGRFHSKWLNMMYPRLYLARNLLRDDGVIFISIDDHEAANLRKIGDDIFGEENFLAQLSWRTDGNFDNQAKFKRCHEYILIWAKNATDFPHPPVVDPTTPPDSKLFKDVIRNTIVKNGPKNPVSAIELPAGFPADFEVGTIPARKDNWPHYLSEARVASGKLTAPVVVESGWSSKELLVEFIRAECLPIVDAREQETRFVITRTGAIEAIKTRTERGSHVVTSLSGFGGPQKATAEVVERLGIPFEDYPKPTALIEYLVRMNEGTDFIVLDFFAGSGTTAHAVLNVNEQDNGKRKFVLVQLPEPTGREDYPTIADMTKERVRRVLGQLEQEQQGKLELQRGDPRDRGFRVFKLAESNFKLWDAAIPEDSVALTTQLELHVDHIREGRTADDLLHEILLKAGFPLAATVESVSLGGKEVYSIAGGVLLVCLERKLTLELMRAMAEMQPQRIVCLDVGFAGSDQLKANAVQIFKTKGVTSFKTV